jgi:hypothetical protein
LAEDFGEALDLRYPILRHRGKADRNESTHVAPICALSRAQSCRVLAAAITCGAVTAGLSVSLSSS